MRALVPMLVVLALTAPAVRADHCETWRTSVPDLTLAVDAETTFYFSWDCDEFCDAGPLAIYLYEESNGIPGQQRQDEIDDGTCHDMIAPDTLIY